MNTLSQTMRFTFTRGAMYGAGLGALYGTLIIPVIGTAYGLVIGGVLGAVLGIPMGLVIWWVTKQFFMPLTDLKRYRVVICSLCAVLAYVGALAGLVLFYGREDWYGSYVQLPALVAEAASALAAYQFTKRYTPRSTLEDVPAQQLQRDVR